MAWARLDDTYATHPKLITAGLEATGLDARAIAHCAKHETDGYVGASEALMLACGAHRPAAVIAALVRVGRWHKVAKGQVGASCRCLTEHGINWAEHEGEGYVVHDFLVYNERHSRAESRRKADRARKDSARNPRGIQTESRRTPPGPPAPAWERVPAPGDPSLGLTSSLPQHQGVVGRAAEEEDEPSTTDPAVAAVARAVAERRLARRRGPALASPQQWLAKVGSTTLADSRAIIEAMLADGMSHAEVVEALDPAPPEPGVERRDCCGASTVTPHMVGCSKASDPVWGEDEHGRAVRMAG